MSNQIFNRYFGCELEGYTTSNPRLFPVHNARKKMDSSLLNYDWSLSAEYWGIEVACHKTRHVDDVLMIFDQLKKRGWHVGNHAGTHIHVETSDFSTKDIAKMMMFCSDLQEIPFMFTKDYRYGNIYSDFFDESWSDVLNPEIYKIPDDAWESAGCRILKDFLSEWNAWDTWNTAGLHCAKYSWVNVHTQYPTIEFRLFNAIENEQEIINFVNMAVGMVELVKNSTVEQLKFISHEIHNAGNAFEIGKKFLYAIGIDWEVPFVGLKAINNLTARKDFGLHRNGLFTAI